MESHTVQVNDVMNHLNGLGPALAPLYRDEYRAQIEQSGLDNGAWAALASAHDYEPEGVSVKRIAYRNPYHNPAVFARDLETATEQGLLEPAGEGVYHVSAKGNTAFDAIMDALHTRLRELNTLDGAELAAGVALLGRVIENALTLAEPAQKDALIVNRSSDPGPDAPPLFRLMQYLADLGSFRDDCHLAAWRSLGVSGPAWEAFSFVWRDQANTPAALAEKLSHREWDEAAYAAALGEAVALGWLVEVGDGSFQVTDAGRAVRQQAEDETDRLYDAAWSVLSDDERRALIALGDDLKQRAAALAPAEPV